MGYKIKCIARRLAVSLHGRVKYIKRVSMLKSLTQQKAWELLPKRRYHEMMSWISFICQRLNTTLNYESVSGSRHFFFLEKSDEKCSFSIETIAVVRLVSGLYIYLLIDLIGGVRSYWRIFSDAEQHFGERNPGGSRGKPEPSACCWETFPLRPESQHELDLNSYPI